MRDGMSNAVQELRRRCDAGTAEFMAGTVTYYSDDHLLATLDRHRSDLRRQHLRMEPTYSGGQVVYQDYYWERGDWIEEAASGAAAWVVEDSAGSAVGTAGYSVNYSAKHLRFSADTTGIAYLLSYRTYDLDRAAAEVWEDKAAHVADRFDVKTDNHDLKRSQLRQSYLAMAANFRRRAPVRSRERTRGDVTP